MKHDAVWTALQVLTGTEQEVLAKLNALPDVEAVAPIETVVHRKEGQRRAVSRPMLPGYVLMQWVFDGDLWHRVQRICGVIRFLGGGTPHVIPEEQMTVFLALCAHCASGQPAPAVREEGRTQITGGALVPYSDRITAVNARAGRARLDILLLDETHVITVGIDIKDQMKPEQGGG